jgi:hypothetical protein
MGMAVVTVASGGMPVVDVSATVKIGMPVTEAGNKYGVPVTKVAAFGLPVVYVTAPLILEADDTRADRGRARSLAD